MLPSNPSNLNHTTIPSAQSPSSSQAATTVQTHLLKRLAESRSSLSRSIRKNTSRTKRASKKTLLSRAANSLSINNGGRRGSDKASKGDNGKGELHFCGVFVVGIGIKIIVGDLAVRTVVGLLKMNLLKERLEMERTRKRASFPPFSTKSGGDQRIYSSITRTVPSTSNTSYVIPNGHRFTAS